MRILAAIGALAVAACSGEAPPPPAPAVPARLPAGEWEVTSTVTDLRSTDKTTPATAAKIGDRATARACVAADGVPPPELFAAPGNTCTAREPYVRNGRMTVQLECTRPGSGKVMAEVSGTFTADTLKGNVGTTSFFAGSGDYHLVQDVTGRRVGECPAAERS